MHSRLTRIAIMSMLLAMAAVLSYLESFIPVFVPGVKLGLANVIILIMLYEFHSYEAGIVDILRILIVALIRSTFLTPTFFMSLAGGVLSFLVMFLFSRIRVFSVIGVGILGSIAHSVGQILIAIVFVDSKAVVYYLPFIALLSLATGIFSGFIARTYLKRSITNKFIDTNGFIKENEE
jgi:heptaprenyl diphosphate synthase